MLPATSKPDAEVKHRRVTHRRYEPQLQAEAESFVLSQVWNSESTLLGKVFFGTIPAATTFAGDG